MRRRGHPRINQAMAHGLPVVATTCAAEGMYLTDDEDVLLADDTESFAAAVVRAYEDPELWSRLSAGGLANVERYFSHTAVTRELESLLEELAGRFRCSRNHCKSL